MSDPAIEAAQRAWKARTPRSEWRNALCANPHDIAAAREALKPIRELHRAYVTNDPRSPHDVVCNHCLGPREWPCPTAHRVYTTEELA